MIVEPFLVSWKKLKVFIFQNGVRPIRYFPIAISVLVAFNQCKYNKTYVLLYTRKVQTYAGADMQTGLQMSLIWRCSCNDWANKLPNNLLQQFLHWKERLRIALSLVLTGQDGRCVCSLTGTSNILNLGLIFLRKVLVAWQVYQHITAHFSFNIYKIFSDWKGGIKHNITYM